jgi:hypothetical protein
MLLRSRKICSAFWHRADWVSVTIQARHLEDLGRACLNEIFDGLPTSWVRPPDGVFKPDGVMFGSRGNPAARPAKARSRIAAIDVWAASLVKEGPMYAAIRQGKAKPGMVEELARRIKEGAIPIISDVEGFIAYYVVYAPDDTVTAISLFNHYAQAEEANRRALAWIEQELAPLLVGPATAVAGPVIVHTLA